MLNRPCLALAAAAFLALPGGVLAQERKEPTEAEAAAAMERAKRMAANPMLRILEASKVRRRVVEGEAADGPAEAGGARRGAALVSAAVVSDALALPAARSTVAPVAPTAAPEAGPAPAPQPTLNSDALRGRAAIVAVPALEAPGTVTSVASQAKALPEPTLPAMPAPTPKLVSMVEPEIPPRVLAGYGAVVEVTAELTIRPDGRVAGVSVPSTANRSLHRYVVAALMEWVYEPLPAEQVQRVQLVFRANN